jgi:nicotinamidase/pyrazinamidase
MKTVFFDVDTQIDFLFPSGALYVPGAEAIVATVAALNKAAPVLVSTMDAHAEDDPEFRTYPPHCVAGTLGQRKPAATLVGQTFIEKQTLDCFLAPKTAEILAQLNADRYVVYGVVTEICVKFAIEGLLKTGKRVGLVTDAVKALDERAAAEFLDSFQRSGGTITTSSAILASVF